MKPTNDYVAVRAITIKRRSFPVGKPFPAADLGIDERSFDSLVRDGVLIPHAKFKAPEPEKPDGLEKWPRLKLIGRADELGIMGVEQLSKSELIREIRSRRK